MPAASAEFSSRTCTRGWFRVKSLGLRIRGRNNKNRAPFKGTFRVKGYYKGSIRIFNVGAFMSRIGFGGPLYYNYTIIMLRNKEPPK